MSEVNSSNEAANKILVIGGSTYNLCTPCKIRDALVDSCFLEQWAVIFANHLYFYPGSTNYYCKISHEFYKIPYKTIDKIKNYPINKGYFYILPEETDFNINYQNNQIDIQVSKLNSGKKLSIDKVMKDIVLAQPQIQIAGLIICGRFQDGADGLNQIQNSGGKTAVQNPHECFHPDMVIFGNDTDSMPNKALALNSSHVIVSLEIPPTEMTLMEWLYTL